MQSLPRRLRGFTLIELLVVIAIIGILSTIVLASLNSARMKSRDARRLSDVKQLQLALAVYADSHGGSFPKQLTALAPLYMSVLPTDPSTGLPYAYSALGPGGVCSDNEVTSYHLGAVLEDETNQYLATDGDFAANEALICSSHDFEGSSLNCSLTTNTTDKCYDVKP